MKTLYCLKHEHSTLVQNSPTGNIHEVLFFNEFGMLDIDFCNYPCGWSVCPPPDGEEDWEDFLIEPCDEELDFMNSESQYIFSSKDMEYVCQDTLNYPKKCGH